MRYFSHDEPDDNGDPIVVTMSEDEIREQFYPLWYEKMCKRYSKDQVDMFFSFEDCLDDWKIINYAREVKE